MSEIIIAAADAIDRDATLFNIETYKDEHFSPLHSPKDWLVRSKEHALYHKSNPSVKQRSLSHSFLLFDAEELKVPEPTWDQQKECATIIRLHNNYIYIGFDSGKIRKFNKSLKLMLLEEQLEAPILDINPYVQRNWLYVIGGPKLYGVHHKRVKPVDSRFDHFIEVITDTRHGTLVISKNGYLSRIVIDSSNQPELLPITQLATQITSCSWVEDNDEDPDDGAIGDAINILVHCADRMAIFHIHETAGGKELVADLIVDIDYEGEWIRHSVLLNERIIFFTGEPLHRPGLKVKEFDVQGQQYLPYQRETSTELRLPIKTINQFERFNNVLLLSAEPNVILIFTGYLCRDDPEFLIQLGEEPEKVVFYRGYLLIAYRTNRFQIKLLRDIHEPEAYVCGDCIWFFNNVLNYKEGAHTWGYCKHHFE